MTGRWVGSDRRSLLPDDWTTRRLEVKRRAHGQCQAKAHVDDCDLIGSECDHVSGATDHSLTNLQWLSAACHKAKTQGEAKRARGVGGTRRGRSHPADVAPPPPPARK